MQRWARSCLCNKPAARANAASALALDQDLGSLDSEEAPDTLIVNLWIPLVDARVIHGCMEMIRGTQSGQLLAHDGQTVLPDGRLTAGIKEENLPPGEVVAGGLNVGDVLLTAERLVHRSLPNTSSIVRWSVDTRYSALGLPTGRADLPGFVARSRRHPERVARSADDWNRAAEAG